jgi:hypothetical protein
MRGSKRLFRCTRSMFDSPRLVFFHIDAFVCVCMCVRIPWGHVSVATASPPGLHPAGAGTGADRRTAGGGRPSAGNRSRIIASISIRRIHRERRSNHEDAHITSMRGHIERRDRECCSRVFTFSGSLCKRIDVSLILILCPRLSEWPPYCVCLFALIRANLFPRNPKLKQADQCSAAIAKGDYAGAVGPCNNVMGVITAAAGSTLDMCVPRGGVPFGLMRVWWIEGRSPESGGSWVQSRGLGGGSRRNGRHAIFVCFCL